MKPVTGADLCHLADQLERTSRILRASGHEAVRRASDWSGSALRAKGTDPGRGKGNVSDPTQTAALQDMDHPDPNAEQLVLLTSEAGRCFDAVVTLESRVARIAVDRVTVNERAGIGWCACGRYADGTASNRLRCGQCPACDQKERRESKGSDPCTHPKQRWANGATTCVSCGMVLTAAGTPA